MIIYNLLVESIPLFFPPTILLIGINGMGPFKSTYKANFKILRHFHQEYLIGTKKSITFYMHFSEIVHFFHRFYIPNTMTTTTN